MQFVTGMLDVHHGQLRSRVAKRNPVFASCVGKEVGMTPVGLLPRHVTPDRGRGRANVVSRSTDSSQPETRRDPATIQAAAAPANARDGSGRGSPRPQLLRPLQPRQ